MIKNFIGSSKEEEKTILFLLHCIQILTFTWKTCIWKACISFKTPRTEEWRKHYSVQIVSIHSLPWMLFFDFLFLYSRLRFQWIKLRTTIKKLYYWSDGVCWQILMNAYFSESFTSKFDFIKFRNDYILKWFDISFIDMTYLYIETLNRTKWFETRF